MRSGRSEPTWFFPPLGGGEESGLNEPGIETFKRAERLAREITQNVQDNRDPEKLSAGEPAIVTFEHLDLPVGEIPGVERLRQIFEACRDHVLRRYGTTNGAGNEKAFFENALRHLAAPRVPVLRAGDENTTGLAGFDDDPSSSFWRLIRGQGYSSEQGPGGGTFGIGQRAPFAHSALRTVLYSTRLKDGSEAFVGKTILASFADPELGDTTQNTGWWGIPVPSGHGWATVRDLDRIPHRFRRSEVGTDLYVLGYERADWQRCIRWSILEHFFAAIAGGQLIVRLMLDGKLLEEINASNLDETLIDACNEARDALSKKDYTAGLGSTLYFQRALRIPFNGEPFETRIARLGTVKLYVHRDADAPDRWCTMRTPRILVETHGSRVLRGYSAVVLCDDPVGNRLLSSMEGPAHESWHEDHLRGRTHADQKAAREARLEITRFVRATLQKLRAAGQPDEQDVPDLGRYLPVEDDPLGTAAPGAATEPTAEHTDEESGLRKTSDGDRPVSQKLDRRTAPGPASAAPGGQGSEEGGSGRRRGGRRRGLRRQKGGKGEEQTLRSREVRFRSFLVRSGLYRVVLAASEDMAGDARLVAVGEDSDYEVSISSIQETGGGPPVEYSGNRLRKLTLRADEPLSLDVEVDSANPLCLALGN